MTTTAVAVPAQRTADRARILGKLPRFWLFQIAGWLAYGVAMTLSRLGIFPLRYMVVTKGMLMVSGFLCSLVLWRAYRALLRRDPALWQIIVAAVVGSYLMATVWTAIDNVGDIPVAAS